MTEPLTESEVTRFHQNGYVVPDYALPAETINELNSALEETIAFNPSVPVSYTHLTLPTNREV